MPLNFVQLNEPITTVGNVAPTQYPIMAGKCRRRSMFIVELSHS